MTILYKVDASVGAGKTTAYVNMVSESVCKSIYAAPTGVLAKQTGDTLMSLGIVVYAALSSYEVGDCMMDEIDHTEGRYVDIVSKIDFEIGRFYSDVPTKCMIITHAGLMMYLKSKDVSNKHLLARMNLVVDEQLPILKCSNFTLGEKKSLKSFDKYLTHTATRSSDIDEISVSSDMDKDVSRILEGTHHYHELDNDRFRHILRDVTDPSMRTYSTKSVNGDRLSIKLVSILDPNFIDSHFNRTIFMAATFEDTLQSLLWENIFDVEFKAYETIQAKLTINNHQNGKRLRIRYLLPDDQRASKQMYDGFDRDSSKSTSRSDMISTISDHWDDGFFIYATHNSWSDDKKGNIHEFNSLQNVVKLSMKSHGQNKYSHYYRVAALFCSRFDNYTLKILSSLCDVDPELLNMILKTDCVYQLVGRSALRKHDFMELNAFCEVIVIDREMAECIQAIFEGSTIVGRLGTTSRPNADRERKRRSDSQNIPKSVLKYLSKNKSKVKSDPSYKMRGSTAEKIQNYITEYPSSNYTLSDFNL